MSETKSGECSQCGKEIIDPYCEEACPKHLCAECGMKCHESLPANQDEWPDPDKCEECPYEANDEPETDEPEPEEMQEFAEEEEYY